MYTVFLHVYPLSITDNYLLIQTGEREEREKERERERL